MAAGGLVPWRSISSVMKPFTTPAARIWDSVSHDAGGAKLIRTRYLYEECD